MNYNSIYLSRKEMRRFWEIAAGDTAAKNIPEEDALFRKKLVKERMLVFINPNTGTTSADQRAVVLSDLGKEYYAQLMNERKIARKEDRRYWLSIALTLIGIAVSIAAIAIPYILSTSG